MKLLSAFYRRPLGVITIALCLTCVGVVAALRIPVNLYPHVQVPALTITTELFDSDPSEVETLITRPIEEALSNAPGLKKMMSYSRNGQSEVTLHFHHGHNISEAALEVRGRLRRLTPTLPKDVRSPVISRYNPQDTPVVVLAVTAADFDASRRATDVMQSRLNRIPDVAAVRVSGAPSKEIVVDCDGGRLDALNITVHDIAAGIETGHIGLPGGFLKIGDRRIALRTAGLLTDPESVERLPVSASKQGAPLLVGDVARVFTETKEPEEIVRLNGKPLTSVAVFRSAEADLRSLGHAVAGAVQDFAAKNKTADVRVIFNQADELDRSLRHIYTLIPLSGLITAVVLYLFLGSLSSTLVILATLPFSLCVTIALLRLFGFSLDLLSLTGLTLGLGILVDNAIVVIEAVAKRRDEGDSRIEALDNAAAETATPLTLATILTIAVFFPVLFISHDFRVQFSGFTWAVTMSLTASLICAIVLTPVLQGYLKPKRVKAAGIINFGVLSSAFQRVFVFGNRFFPVVCALVLIFLGYAYLCGRNLSFRPSDFTSMRQAKVHMLLPAATRKEVTAQKAREVEDRLVGFPWVSRLLTEIKGSQATFHITVADDAPQRDWTPLIAEALGHVTTSDGEKAQIHILPMDEQGSERAITLNVYGRNPTELTSLGEQVRIKLTNVPGVRDTLVHQGNTIPAVECVVSHGRLGFYGVDTEAFAQQLRGNLTGPVAARIRGPKGTTQVRVRLQRSTDDGLAFLSGAYVPTRRGGIIPLSELTEPRVRMVPSLLMRENKKPVIPMTVQLADADPLVVANRVTEALGALTFSAGAAWSFGPEVKDLLRTRREALWAGAVSLILIYLMLVMATESLLQPFFIMTAIPFALGGAVIALSWAGAAMAMPVYMGMLILCGLVVNINIVLAYTMNALRHRGLAPEEAALMGAQRRLRPILMSTTTAVAGSLPMLLDKGPGASIWAPFALTLSSGIGAAAVFSLALMPILYVKTARGKCSLNEQSPVESAGEPQKTSCR